MNQSTLKKSLLEDFKHKFVYQDLDNFGNLSKIITSNDFNSAAYISSITSLVYSIINMSNSEYKAITNKNNPTLLKTHLDKLFEHSNYLKLFSYKNNYVVYGYNNCCFLWDKKRFEKHDDETPLYCDYLAEKTVGLSNYRFNPYLHIWIRALQTVYYQWMRIKHDKRCQGIDALIKRYGGIDDDFPDLSTTIELPISRDQFNIATTLLHYIRKEADHPLVVNDIRNFKDSPARNAASATHYINHLFDRYSKLLVLRIDLGYKKATFNKKNIDKDYAQIQNDRDRFFNNMRHNALFKRKVGYISKLEYGLDKGFHYHLILFFDGSKAQRDQYLASKICQYWNENITQGQGNAFNCHAKKDKYRFMGIGKISYTDTVLRNNLIQHVVRYLIKPDLFARLVMPNKTKGSHLFERGQTKRVKAPRGRKRRSIPAINSDRLRQNSH